MLQNVRLLYFSNAAVLILTWKILSGGYNVREVQLHKTHSRTLNKWFSNREQKLRCFAVRLRNHVTLFIFDDN